MKLSMPSTPAIDTRLRDTAPLRVPNLPRDSQGRPYHTQETLDEERRQLAKADLSKVRVW